jgi:serine/threonine-protein kinase
MLGESQLLEPHQLEALDQLPEAHGEDVQLLAKKIVKRGWLTVYQVNHLLQGRGRQLLFGSYVLLDRLGEGGMGQVFKARHRNLDRLCALKIVRKECLANPDAVRRRGPPVPARGQGGGAFVPPQHHHRL